MNEETQMQIIERLSKLEQKVESIEKGRLGFIAGVVATLLFVWSLFLAAANFFFQR